MFINIGKADFEAIRKGEYVDKSMLIAFVNSRIGLYDKFICVTRARRFGKSMAAKMLKYNKSAEGAITQIKEKGYTDVLKNIVGDIVLVGINYNKQTKHHSCVIERISDKTSDKLPINDAVSAKLQKIIDYMLANKGMITQVVVAKMFAVSDRQARNYLTELINAGLVEPQGANKNRIYVLKV